MGLLSNILGFIFGSRKLRLRDVLSTTSSVIYVLDKIVRLAYDGKPVLHWPTDNLHRVFTSKEKLVLESLGLSAHQITLAEQLSKLIKDKQITGNTEILLVNSDNIQHPKYFVLRDITEVEGINVLVLDAINELGSMDLVNGDMLRRKKMNSRIAQSNTASSGSRTTTRSHDDNDASLYASMAYYHSPSSGSSSSSSGGGRSSRSDDCSSGSSDYGSSDGGGSCD